MSVPWQSWGEILHKSPVMTVELISQAEGAY